MVKEREASGTNWNTGGLLWTSGNIFLLWGWLAHVAQGHCGVSSLGDTQKLSGHSPEWTPLSAASQARNSDKMIYWGDFQPLSVCHSVIAQLEGLHGFTAAKMLKKHFKKSCIILLLILRLRLMRSVWAVPLWVHRQFLWHKGCCQSALPFSGGKGETTTLYIFRVCNASHFRLAVEAPALGCCAHCRVSPAAEISVVTAGQGTCQEAQEISGTAAMLMLSLIMQLEI